MGEMILIGGAEDGGGAGTVKLFNGWPWLLRLPSLPRGDGWLPAGPKLGAAKEADAAAAAGLIKLVRLS